MNAAFLIFVTGRFHWLVPAVLHFYDKYMPVPITFVTDREMAGSIKVFPEAMPIYKQPCGYLIKEALEKIDAPVVMLGLTDVLPIQPVNMEHLGVLVRYMEDDIFAARGNLWSDADDCLRFCQDVVMLGASFRILRLPRNDPYIGQIGATSLMPALWRKDFLLEFFDDGWTLDGIELPGQHKFEQQGKWHSVALVPGMMTCCHLCYTATPGEARLSTIPDPADRAFVRQFVPKEMRVT